MIASHFCMTYEKMKGLGRAIREGVFLETDATRPPCSMETKKGVEEKNSKEKD